MPYLVLGIIFGFSFAIVALVFYADHRKRLLHHQERIAAIEKGLLPGDLEKMPAEEHSCGRRGRYHGLTTLFVGMGLALALYVTSGPRTAVWGLFVAIIAMGQLLQSHLAYRGSEGRGG